MQKIKRTLGFILAHPIGERHLLRCLWQSFVWQIQATLFPRKSIIKRFIGPVRFYAQKGQTGITGNIYVGLHEFYDQAFLLHLLRPEDLFFDVGANVGSYTLLASGYCKAQSVAIEPAESTFALLTKNIVLNQIQQLVLPINSVAGGKESTVTFKTNEDTTNHVVAPGEDSENDVALIPMLTIDNIARGKSPILIKIDVEGFETEVLNGMNDTLADPSLKAIIIELNGSGTRYGYQEDAIHELLVTKGFRPFVYDPSSRSLTEIQRFGNHNTIYCRDTKFITRRLQEAPTIVVMGERF